MPTIKYSNNPNSDTVFVVQDGGQKNRAVLAAEPSGTLQLSDSANVSTGYVTGEDGKKHKVNLVAQLEGDIEFSENPNSTKGYATIDGKKHRVVLTASLSGGGEPINNQDKTITANGSYTADEGYTGLGTVIVNVPNPSTGTKSITENGVYDVTDFASADVQVPTTAPEIYRVFRSNNGKLENSITTPFLPLPNTITDIDDFCYCNAYKNTSASVLSGTINLSGLTTISGQQACANMFNGCAGLTNFNLSSLTTISGQSACYDMFSNCPNLTSVDLPSLTTISSNRSCGYMFAYCPNLTSVDLSSLTTMSGQYACYDMFRNCTSITSVNLPSLTTLYANVCANMFEGCTSLTSLSFPALTSNSFGSYKNQFSNMLYGVTGCTIHFPSNLDPQSGSTVISLLQGYPNFGGTNTILAFDLPATE